MYAIFIIQKESGNLTFQVALKAWVSFHS